MKRFLIFGLMAVVIAAIPLSHTLKAGPPEKISICHLNDANDMIDLGFFGTLMFGRVINVSENAWQDHMEHGDSMYFLDASQIPGGLMRLINHWFTEHGITLINWNCVFFAD